MTTIEVIFEDEDIIIVNKPSGIAVQSDNGITLKEHFTKTVFLTHRLDQRVSGLLILAKNKKTQALLNQQFQNNSIKKIYKAVVANKPVLDKATLTHWLLKDAKKQKVRTFNKEVQHSQKAILDYEILHSSLKYHLLQINLNTGRFHQIRAQLAAQNSPIVGDLKYGYPRSTPDGSIFLQSNEIAFSHPVKGTPISFNLPIPTLWGKYGFE